ncbi:MAG: ATP-binding protein [Chloroflexota bacterium]
MLEELSIDKLRRVCAPEALDFHTTEAVEPLAGILGQERAVRSLQFGLGIKEQGFNIYVAGTPGTGRTTAVKGFLEELAKEKPIPPDWCYVNNFRDPYRPRALRLPPGRGKEFHKDMKALVEGARREIPKAFESEEYSARREGMVEALQKRRQGLLHDLRCKAQEAGFALQSAPVGLLIIPLKEGVPMGDEGFAALPEQAREDIMRRRETVEAEIKAAMKQIRGAEKATSEQLQDMDRDVALYAVGLLLEELTEKYRDFPEVLSYLKEVQDDMVANLAPFRGVPEAEPSPLAAPWAKEAPFRKYAVNAIVDNSDLYGGPVIMEFSPTYNNLFGRVEKEAQFGTLVTDFTMLRGGSLHRANGGYLVLQAEQVLQDPLTWDGLKRALRSREIAIEEIAERLGFMATKSLRPEPIPLDIKVIIIGNPQIYHLLYALDPDFKELFKVKADFDTRMERSDENVRSYTAFVRATCQKENLLHLDRSAVAKIVEHGSRLAEDQDKLSTHFAEIADILREASFYATREGSPHINASHVTKAIEEKVYRSNLIQERLREMIAQGTIMIATAGEAVGQVNGLSLISLGDFAFGRPSRITASFGLGREGVLDIEREAKLGGPIHTKGVLILSGYLAQRYAQDKPLSLSARLVFEQSYEGVEGDSASCAELYALLSALSGLPIRQGLAVTGSVNQRGEVQAIGGVNEKVEGFYEVCKAKGLTGEQGVLIPESNVRHLMLKEGVVEAIQQGKFHVYPVKNVDQGIELLTGVSAGMRQDDGSFPEGTVNGRVDRCLRELAERLKGFAEEGKKKTGEG